MTGIRLRHLAEVNPSVPEFERLAPDVELTFLPLEAVWPGTRLDGTRTRPKEEVASGYTRFREGDVLVPKITPTFEADRSTIARGLLHGIGCGTTELHVVRPSAALEPRYVDYLVSSRQFLLGGEAEMIGVAGQKRVPDSWLRDFPVPITARRAQRSIADFLDRETASIDAIIEKKRRMTELIVERWGAHVRSLVSGPSCQPFEVLPLKRRWRIIDCKHRTPDYVPDGYPVVSPGDIDPGRLDLSNCHRFVAEEDFADLTEGRRRPRRGDLVYSRNASIGIAAYVDTDEAFCMGQDVCLITSDDQDQRFLLYALNTLGLDQMDAAKIGSTLSRINVALIGEIQLPAPPTAAQASVAEALDRQGATVDRLTAQLREQIDLLREHRQALVTAAVTGQLDLAEAA